MRHPVLLIAALAVACALALSGALPRTSAASIPMMEPRVIAPRLLERHDAPIIPPSRAGGLRDLSPETQVPPIPPLMVVVLLLLASKPLVDRVSAPRTRGSNGHTDLAQPDWRDWHR